MMYLLFMDISDKILSDPVIHWIFSIAGKDAYLVGGYVRDLLRGRMNRDRDFVLKRNARQTALKTAKKYNGTFIELKKNKTYRVALGEGHFIDFNVLDSSLRHDLLKRDFTINMIAWSPSTGLIDPLKGEADVNNGIIRAVRPQNLSADPLRVLRAYRLSAQLDFEIERKTRMYLKQHAAGITGVAKERITEELFKLLNTSKAGALLKTCNKDKVISLITGLTLYKLRDNCDFIAKYDDFMQKTDKSKSKDKVSRKLRSVLNEYISQGLSGHGFIRLSMLLMNRTSSGRKTDKHMLILSNSIKKRLTGIQSAIDISNKRITDKKLYQIFRISNGCEYEMSVILSILKQRPVNKYVERAGDFIKIKNKCLLSGEEIQKILKVSPGPVIGKIQDTLKERQFTKTIRNKPGARNWILSNLT